MQDDKIENFESSFLDNIPDYEEEPTFIRRVIVKLLKAFVISGGVILLLGAIFVFILGNKFNIKTEDWINIIKDKKSMKEILSNNMYGKSTTEDITEEEEVNEERIDSENLPTWNLENLYKGTKDPIIQKDLSLLRQKCASFFGEHKPSSENNNIENFIKSLNDYEEIILISSKLSAYSRLLKASNMINPEFKRVDDQINDSINNSISSISFYNLYLRNLSEEKISAMILENPVLEEYKYFLLTQIRYKHHTLSEEAERYSIKKDSTSRRAWVDLFDEEMASMFFEIPNYNKPLNLSEVLAMFQEKKEEDRKNAAEALSNKLNSKVKLLSKIYSNIIQDRTVDNEFRKYNNVLSSRNLDNQIEDQVVEALMSSVKKHYEKTSHRYYKMKASLFNKTDIPYYDRVAPLPMQTNRQYSWEESTKMVKEAYNNFAPQMGIIVDDFLNNRWIDAEARNNKESGAFSMPINTKEHPYIMLNFLGKERDVYTLAHELGHGIHQVLSQKQNILYYDTPLTLAETASIFGERLLFEKMLSECKDNKSKVILLASKIEDILATVVRQVAFADFEYSVHKESKKERLTPEKISNIWMATQSESFGPSIVLDKSYENYWAYVPHFFHAPFYVYSYAFGELLTSALYQIYKDKNVDNFQEKYIKLLSSGGSNDYKVLLSDFNLNPSHTDFWDKGMNYISNMIDELEALIGQLNEKEKSMLLNIKDEDSEDINSLESPETT